MLPISDLAGPDGGLRCEEIAMEAERVSRRGVGAMSLWEVLEATLLVGLGFMGGWAMNVLNYASVNGLPAQLVASSSVYAAVAASLIAAAATIGCANAASGGQGCAITRSGAAEAVAVLSSFTAAALGLHAALWLVG